MGKLLTADEARGEMASQQSRNANTNLALDVVDRVAGAPPKYEEAYSIEKPVLPDWVEPELKTSTSEIPGVMNKSAEAGVAGTQIESDLGEKATREAAGKYDDISQDSSDFQNQLELAKRYQKSQEDLQNIGDNYEKFLDSVDAKVDPTRYVKNLGVSGKTLTALGMILGGIGAGLTGGPNIAAQIFQKNVESDIESQTKNIQNQLITYTKRQGIAMDRVKLADMAQMARSKGTLDVMNGVLASTKQQILNATYAGNRERATELYAKYKTAEQQLLLNTANVVKGSMKRDSKFTSGILGALARSHGKIPENANLVPDKPLTTEESEILKSRQEPIKEEEKSIPYKVVETVGNFFGLGDKKEAAKKTPTPYTEETKSKKVDAFGKAIPEFKGKGGYLDE